jgi:predicted regulator of amino acid metabolism with ACT domain
MRKNNILQENIFATLAKIWAAFQIERKIGDVIDKIPNDPKLRKAFEDIRTADETIKRELNMFC